MKQKKYQKLRPNNMLAAKRLYDVLKRNKCISYETMAETYQRATHCSRSGSFNNLIKTTLQFMEDHNLMTRHLINGLIVYVATQKCFRTMCFENAIKETQVTTDELIDQAINYIEMNAGDVPAEFEGKVAGKIIGLEGKILERFQMYYNYACDYEYGGTHPYLERKYQIIGPVMHLMGERILKKV